MITGAVVVLPDHFGRRAILVGAAAILGVVLLVSLLAPLVAPRRPRPSEPEPADEEVSA